MRVLYIGRLTPPDVCTCLNLSVTPKMIKVMGIRTMSNQSTELNYHNSNIIIIAKRVC
jgi:hypothetical protein